MGIYRDYKLFFLRMSMKFLYILDTVNPGPKGAGFETITKSLLVLLRIGPR